MGVNPPSCLIRYVPEMSNKEIGRQLSTVRRAAGLKQVDLAEKLPLHQSTVSMIETGASGTSTDTLLRWAEVCGATVRIEREPDVEAARLSAAYQGLDPVRRGLLVRFATLLGAVPVPSAEGMIIGLEMFSGTNRPH